MAKIQIEIPEDECASCGAEEFEVHALVVRATGPGWDALCPPCLAALMLAAHQVLLGVQPTARQRVRRGH